MPHKSPTSQQCSKGVNGNNPTTRCRTSTRQPRPQTPFPLAESTGDRDRDRDGARAGLAPARRAALPVQEQVDLSVERGFGPRRARDPLRKHPDHPRVSAKNVERG